MNTLFEETAVGNMNLRNRVVMAPMTRARAAVRGLATPSMATYYAQRASAGLIVSEGIQPSLLGQSNPGTPGLHSDEQVASWRPVTSAVHDQGSRIVAQIMHGGRVSHHETTGLQPVAPSPVSVGADVFTPTGPKPGPVPRALSTAEVGVEAASYASAAARAIDAGFDAVELHGANGYLISQFLSSNANLRTDRYGGTIANRIRFAVEAVEAVAAEVGGSRTAIRLSPGFDVWNVEDRDVPEMYAALLEALAPLDLAYIHVEATTDETVLMELRRLWPGAFMINPALPGGARRADQTAALHWLSQGADLISFGRSFISNPDLVERLRADLPLALDDEATWYAGGDDGYITYPTHETKVA